MFKKRTVKKTDTSQTQKRKRNVESEVQTVESRSNISGKQQLEPELDKEEQEDDHIVIKPVFKKGKRQKLENSKVDEDTEKLSNESGFESYDDEQHSEVQEDDDAKRHSKGLFETDRLLQEEHDRLTLSKSKNEIVNQPQERDSSGNKIYKGLETKKNSNNLLKPAPMHIKTTTVMDFQADVCKDFLKNGYCGFGDTCKFLHYRDEFKVVKNVKSSEWEDVLKKNKKY